MTERLPEGNDPWQDGDVLTAADLNDTITSLTDGVDTLGEESQENRLLINQIQFQTSADPAGDSENLLVDIATDSDGYRDTITTTNSNHVTTGTALQNFHYYELNSEFSVTQTNVSIGKSFEIQSYDPINDEVFIGVNAQEDSGNSDNVQVNYELYDTSGNQIKTGSVSTLVSATASVPSATLIHADYISEGVVGCIFQANDDNGHVHAYISIIDVKNDNFKSEKQLQFEDQVAWCGATCAESGQNGVFFARYRSADSESGTHKGEDGLGITQLSSNSRSLGDYGIGIYDGGSFVAGYNVGNDTEVIAASMGESNSLNIGDSVDGTDTGFFEDSWYVDNNNAGKARVNLTNGNLSTANSQNYVQETAFLTGYDSGDEALRSRAGYTYFKVGNNFYSVDGAGVNLGDSNILPSTYRKYYSYEGDGSLYTVRQNSQTVEIYKLENVDSVSKPSPYLFESGSITHTDDIEYINVKIDAIGGDITEFILYDVAAGTEIGTFNTEEKVYIGDQNISDIKVRVDESILPSKVGANGYRVITW